MNLSAAAAHVIAEEISAAAHGDRVSVAQRLSAQYGVSVATIYRRAGRGGTTRQRAATRPEYREWVRIAVQLAHSAPKPIPLDLALEAGIEGGLLPPAAGDMPVQTARRIAREMGWRRQPRRTHRLHAEYPMQAVQVDGSSSEHLLAVEPRGDDWLLRLHRRPYAAGGYKNKPLEAHRMRVWVYSAWDMCTGYTTARYTVARGESALDAMDFLCSALARNPDPRRPLHGIPDDLWSDQGALFKSAAATDLLGRLGIALITGAAYAKERMGGVERSHRTRWERFERSLFLRGQGEMMLSELNARLAEFEARENARHRSRTPVGGRSVSRTDAWVALTNARPPHNPLRELPPRPIETLAQEARRRVDVNGIVRWGGAEYEAPTWCSRWVIARRAVDATGNLVLEDETTGERCVATAYAPRPYGAVRTAPESALDTLLAAPPPASAGADLYAPAGAGGANTGTPTVVRMPARAAPAAPLPDPLDAEHYPTIPEAMRAFCSVYPHPLSATNHAAVVRHIEAAGRSRRAVTALALELAGLAGQNQKGAAQ